MDGGVGMILPLGAKRGLLSPLGRSVQRPATGGWWLSGGIAAANCIAAYQPKGAADLAASKVNLASPGTYNAFAGADPSFDTSTGWTGAGSSYLRTGFTLGAGYSFIVRYTDLTAGAICGGSISAGQGFAVNYYTASNIVPYYGNSGLFGGSFFSGILSLCSVGATGYKLYQNTTLRINNTTTSAPTTYTEQCIMSWTGGYFKGKLTIAAIAFYNIDISSYVAALNTAMAAL